MLLSIAYFPPVEYFTLLASSAGNVFLDASEKYVKQSYRNRCRILTARGVEDLRFPIVHNGSYGIREVMVDYSTPWVRQTEYAMETAYSASPFFEYYRDPLFGILDSHPGTLWELDRALIDFFCCKIGIHSPAEALPGQETGEDFRNLVHPKKTAVLSTPEYWQVFSGKFGFVPNLSIADLLFNEGPESICFLKK